jgi:hypothetical protein
MITDDQKDRLLRQFMQFDLRQDQKALTYAISKPDDKYLCIHFGMPIDHLFLNKRSAEALANAILDVAALLDYDIGV